jgi:hypothetical protein
LRFAKIRVNPCNPWTVFIGDYAFYECFGLTSVSFPNVTSIGSGAFSFYETAALTITMGGTPPTLGYRIFGYQDYAITVTVSVPGGSTGNYDAAWQSSFKDGNDNITLTIIGH